MHVATHASDSRSRGSNKAKRRPFASAFASAMMRIAGRDWSSRRPPESASAQHRQRWRRRANQPLERENFARDDVAMPNSLFLSRQMIRRRTKTLTDESGGSEQSGPEHEDHDDDVDDDDDDVEESNGEGSRQRGELLGLRRRAGPCAGQVHNVCQMRPSR